MSNIEMADKRTTFYDKINDYWADLYGEEYSLYDVLSVTKEEVFNIREATNRIGHIFFKTAFLLRSLDNDTLLGLGFPESTLNYIRISALESETIIARLDLVKDGDSYKCLEINSDTPTFIKELHYINGLICKEFDKHNPNEGFERQLSLAVRNAILECCEKIGTDYFPNVVFTAHEDNVEDSNTLRYLRNLSDIPSQYFPLDKLQIVKDEGLYDANGIKIDVLYRQTFPIENLIEDEDEDGNPIGLWLLELVEQGKLMIINPPSAFLLQSKAVQAVIWGLHEEKNPFYSEEEHKWIENYFLPTYLDAEAFLNSNKKFVMKPSFGREGDTVKIFESGGNLVAEDSQNTYADYLQVFQEYIELPKTKFNTVKGEKEGSYMFGSFLVAGQAGAIGVRVGKQITDNLSYFLPIGI